MSKNLSHCFCFKKSCIRLSQCLLNNNLTYCTDTMVRDNRTSFVTGGRPPNYHSSNLKWYSNNNLVRCNSRRLLWQPKQHNRYHQMQMKRMDRSRMMRRSSSNGRWRHPDHRHLQRYLRCSDRYLSHRRRRRRGSCPIPGWTTVKARGGKGLGWQGPRLGRR